MIYLQFNIIVSVHWKLSCMHTRPNFDYDSREQITFIKNRGRQCVFLVNSLCIYVFLLQFWISHWFNDWKIAIVQAARKNKSSCRDWEWSWRQRRRKTRDISGYFEMLNNSRTNVFHSAHSMQRSAISFNVGFMNKTVEQEIYDFLITFNETLSWFSSFFIPRREEGRLN